MRPGRTAPGGPDPGGMAARWCVAGFALLAAVLAATGLGKPSLWIDEAHSFEFSALPSAWLVVLNAAARDAYPPLYFLLMHFWMKAGTGEVWLRMFSVLCHVAAVPVIYLVGVRLVSRSVGLAAALLLAVSPFHLAFAREIRMYSLMELLSLLSVWGMLKWIQDCSRAGWRVFFGAGLALVYTHYMGALLLAVEALYLIREHKRTLVWRDAERWLGLTILCFLPWSVFFLKAFVVTHGYGAEASPFELAWYFLSVAGAGFGQARWVMAAAMAAVAVTAWLGWRNLPAGPARPLLFLWAFLPPALELLSGLAGKSVFGERTLITATPAWLILAGTALANLPGPRAAALAVCWGALAGLGFAHTQGYILPTANQSRPAVARVLKSAKPGDAILHSSTVTYHPVNEYYLPPSAGKLGNYLVEPQGGFRGGKFGNMFREAWRKVRGFLDPGSVLQTGADTNRLSENGFAERGFRRVWYFRTTGEGMRRLWLIVPATFYLPAGDPHFREIPFASHGRLAREYRMVDSWRYPGMVVELYALR